MGYEKFVPPKKSSSPAKQPAAKILKGGQISLNDTAYSQYLKGSTHVELYYDADAKTIGLKPKKYGTKAAYKLRAVGKKNLLYRVNARPLIDHYGIKLTGKKNLSLGWNDKENLLELSF